MMDPTRSEGGASCCGWGATENLYCGTAALEGMYAFAYVLGADTVLGAAADVYVTVVALPVGLGSVGFTPGLLGCCWDGRADDDVLSTCVGTDMFIAACCCMV